MYTIQTAVSYSSMSWICSLLMYTCVLTVAVGVIINDYVGDQNDQHHTATTYSPLADLTDVEPHKQMVRSLGRTSYMSFVTIICNIPKWKFCKKRLNVLIDDKYVVLKEHSRSHLTVKIKLRMHLDVHMHTLPVRMFGTRSRRTQQSRMSRRSSSPQLSHKQLRRQLKAHVVLKSCRCKCVVVKDKCNRTVFLVGIATGAAMVLLCLFLCSITIVACRARHAKTHTHQ